LQLISETLIIHENRNGYLEKEEKKSYELFFNLSVDFLLRGRLRHCPEYDPQQPGGTSPAPEKSLANLSRFFLKRVNT
jgi:hypothetical protein